jgi:hypothetical protein
MTIEKDILTGNEPQEKLKAAIQAGFDSGISDKKIPDIMIEVEARLLDEGKL